MRQLWALALVASMGMPGQTIAETYRDRANRLIEAALRDSEGYEKLTYLCDRIGHRLSGSEGLKKAVAWSAEQMKRDGAGQLRREPVMVPHWVRGQESAVVVAPVVRPLAMLGLGGSVGTPAEGITAEVASFESFEAMERAGADAVKGKIVLFNAVYRGYGQTVQYRVAGPSRAAGFGAVAMLVRSVASASLRTPHTGTLVYEPGGRKIPAAAIAVEDALQIQRMIDSGATVKVTLKMQAQMLPDAESHNVMAEIVGSEKPEEVVVLGGHIDSWDVGQGAQDDGSGVIAALQAVNLIQKLGLKPRRTIRVVFWTNEENGTRGGRAYLRWAGEAARKHVAALEMDGGAETPLGFGVTMRSAKALEMTREIARLLEPVGASRITEGGGGADIAPLTQIGVPSLGLATTGAHYFDWHHTEADTLDKVNVEDFRKCMASLAVMAYVLADMPEALRSSEVKKFFLLANS